MYFHILSKSLCFPDLMLIGYPCFYAARSRAPRNRLHISITSWQRPSENPAMQGSLSGRPNFT